MTKPKIKQPEFDGGIVLALLNFPDEIRAAGVLAFMAGNEMIESQFDHGERRAITYIRDIDDSTGEASIGWLP